MQPTRENINDRVERVVRSWDQWSRHELTKMDAIVAEVLDHCRNGTGNAFVRQFVNRVVVPAVPGMVAR